MPLLIVFPKSNKNQAGQLQFYSGGQHQDQNYKSPELNTRCPKRNNIKMIQERRSGQQEHEVGRREDYSAFESALNELVGSEILEIFNNLQNFQELLRIGGNFLDTMKRFMWRLKYILGESFLHMQKQLFESGILKNSISLDQEDVRELVNSIVERGKMINQSKEFIKLKNVLETEYNKGQCEENQLITAYNLCMKIWKQPTLFQLSFPNQVTEEKTNPDEKEITVNHANAGMNPRRGPYSVMRMPPNSQNSPSKVETPHKFDSKPAAAPSPNRVEPRQNFKTTEGNKPQAPDSSNPPQQVETTKNSKIQKYQSLLNELTASNPKQSQSTALPKEDDQTINLNNGKEDSQPHKNLNRNWTMPEEEHFCRMFIQYESPAAVKLQLQKKFGVDARWNHPRQIESKMNAITAKIFRKFSSLDTNNPNIVNFRSLKSFVFSSDRITENDRKTLNKLFAIIYESLLNVDNSKKAIISQKIIEVIKVCERIQQSE